MLRYGDGFTPYGAAWSTYGGLILPTPDLTNTDLPKYEASTYGLPIAYEASDGYNLRDK